MQLTLQIMHVRVSESNPSTTTGLFASPDLKNDLDECTPRHTEVAKHPLGPGIGTIANAFNIYLYVHRATN